MKTRFAGPLAAMAAILLATCSTANAAQHIYAFTMNGPSEFPVNASPGTGTGTAIYDDVALTLTLSASFSGLTGNVTQTHFHGLTATSGLPDNNPVGETPEQAAAAAMNASIMVGNPSLPGFPLGANNGVYAAVVDLTLASVYNNGYLNTTHGGNVANARAQFVGGLASGRVYWNIHSSTIGGGEIRGFPVLVPEPATVGLATLALVGLNAMRRRRK